MLNFRYKRLRERGKTSKLFDFSKNFCYNIYRKLRKEKLKMNKRFSNSKDSDLDFREGC